MPPPLPPPPLLPSLGCTHLILDVALPLATAAQSWLPAAPLQPASGSPLQPAATAPHPSGGPLLQPATAAVASRSQGGPLLQPRAVPRRADSLPQPATGAGATAEVASGLPGISVESLVAALGLDLIQHSSVRVQVGAA